MSLFPEAPTTAKQAADKFLQLMRDRPQFWAENVAEVTSHLKDPIQQLDFLRWMADPKGVTPGRNKNARMIPVKPGPGMEDHPDFILTSVVPGAVPTYKVTYRPRSQDEEKTPGPPCFHPSRHIMTE